MRGALSLCSAILGLLTVPSLAAAQTPPPEPDRDPFYAVPGNLSTLPNGAVLDSRAITPFVGPMPLPARAWQLKYKTLGTHDRPTATVTTVLVPHTPWTGPGTRPMVSLQLAEDGVGTRCAPSWAVRGGVLAPPSADASVLLPQLLARGWGVVMSDYEGPRSEFASARMTAHGVLDGIRAARRFGAAGFGTSTPLGMLGYSGGGFATVAARQLQHHYAPDLAFAGIAAGGVPGDLREVFHAANASIYGGAIAVLFIGLDRAFPKARLSRYLNAEGRRVIAGSRTDCLADAAARNPGADFTRYLSAAGIRRFLAVQRRNSPLWLPGVPRAPIHLFHTRDDELVPFAPARALAQRFCAAGSEVDFKADPAGTHIGEGALGATAAIAYLADRFAGKPPPVACPPGS